MKNSIKIFLIFTILLTSCALIFAGFAINNSKQNYNNVAEFTAENNFEDGFSVTAGDNSQTKEAKKKLSPEQTKTVSAKLSGQKDSLTSTSASSNKEKDKTKLSLKGLTICIDAGHGITSKKSSLKEPLAPGSDIMKAAVASGTCGVSTKITEASLNLTVSKKLKKALIDKGANIIMIRESEHCDLTNVERTKLWNSSGADFTVRIHANGINDTTVSGALIMVPGNKYIKNKELLQKSEQIGQYIFDGVLKHTKAKSRGTIVSNDLTGFNWSEIPVVLLEMGFMTNPEEDKLLNTVSYQNKIVAGIVEGIEKYKESVLRDN